MISPGIQIINSSEAGISHSASQQGWPFGISRGLWDFSLTSQKAACQQLSLEHSWPWGSSSLLPPDPERCSGTWREHREAGHVDELDTVGFGRRNTQQDLKALGCLDSPIFWNHGSCLSVESAGCPKPTYYGGCFPFPECREPPLPVTKSLGQAHTRLLVPSVPPFPMGIPMPTPCTVRSHFPPVLPPVSRGAFPRLLSSWPSHKLFPLPAHTVCAHLPGSPEKLKLCPCKSQQP